MGPRRSRHAASGHAGGPFACARPQNRPPSQTLHRAPLKEGSCPHPDGLRLQQEALYMFCTRCEYSLAFGALTFAFEFFCALSRNSGAAEPRTGAAEGSRCSGCGGSNLPHLPPFSQCRHPSPGWSVYKSFAAECLRMLCPALAGQHQKPAGVKFRKRQVTHVSGFSSAVQCQFAVSEMQHHLQRLAVDPQSRDAASAPHLKVRTSDD